MPHQMKTWQRNKNEAVSVKEVVGWVTRLTRANFFSSIPKIFFPYYVLWWRPLTVHGGTSLGTTFGCPAYGLRTDRWDIPSSGKDTHSPSWQRKIASRVQEFLALGDLYQDNNCITFYCVWICIVFEYVFSWVRCLKPLGHPDLIRST